MIAKSAAAAALFTILCSTAAWAAEPPAPVAPEAARPPVAAPQLLPEGQVPLPDTRDAMVAVDGGEDHLLFGSLLRPDGLDSYPAVLILPAQGADRDGNAANQPLKANTYKELANDLAARGVASLRIDKRGVGGSARAIAREDDLRFQTYVDDAVTWIRFLQTQPHVRCVAVLGHSEAALAAALAARKIKVCAVIEMAGSGRTAALVLGEQLKTAADSGELDEATYRQAVQILDTLASGKPSPNPPERLAALFRPSVQPYLISWLSLDPVEALRTSTPVLIVQGSTDFQLNTDDAQRLAAATWSAKLVMIEGADHDLKVAAPQGVKTESGVDPRPVSPQVSAAIADFLKRAR
jgi:pimeloyl-ACP methyl ester carboxylesterase